MQRNEQMTMQPILTGRRKVDWPAEMLAIRREEERRRHPNETEDERVQRQHQAFVALSALRNRTRERLMGGNDGW
jgi:hypothetical protein